MTVGSAAVRACCPACAMDIRDPFSRRYRYPFASCAACGPLAFEDRPCAACAAEGDGRRCYTCGPRAELVRTDGAACSFTSLSMLDDVDAVRTLVQRGQRVVVEDFDGLRLFHATDSPPATLPVTPLQLLILARIEREVPIAIVERPDLADWQLRLRPPSKE